MTESSHTSTATTPGAPSPGAVLALRGIRMEYPGRSGAFRGGAAPRPVLHGIDLDVRRGESLAVVGESGSGKSTLGRIMTGLLRPTGGSLCFDGRDMWSLDRRQRRGLRRELQMIFQDGASALDPRMTVRESVSEGPRAMGLFPRRELDSHVAATLDMVGLPSSAMDKYPHEFSGGQRQRIGIARAIIMRPSVIVADEPTSALDVSIQAHILALFGELRQTLNLTYVLISHNLAAVGHIADRIAVMSEGAVVELAPAKRLADSAAHPYTRRLYSAVPSLIPPTRRDGRDERDERDGRHGDELI
ncbi:ATP-binding cassette domain-containing protein [Streptosporangium sp. NPDC051022]|uniref:ATP-binding cassette domain-containing protein n=1 Tax=Streptosporangium sp. NPDC051022 TaxID=3155752 RepID=UPI003434DBB5